MATPAEQIKQALADVNTFVRDRFDPQEQRVKMLEEEVQRLGKVVTDAQDAEKRARRDAIGRASEGRELTVTSGAYRGMTPLRLKLVGGLSKAADGDKRAAWQRRAAEARASLVEAATPEAVEAWLETYERKLKARFPYERQYARFARPIFDSLTRAAMDSTTASSGDELVPTLEAAELWMDVNLDTLVAPLIPTFNMPSNPFDIPRQLGNVNFYPGTENIATTSTAPTTGKATLTAYELVGQVPYSFSLEEDGVLASLETEIRDSIIRNTAEIMDDVILNADTTATNNINADGATIVATDAGKGHWLLGYDGIIHLPLVDNTGQANDHNAAVSDDMFNEIRAKLGIYGARPSELVWITDVYTFIRAQSISSFRTMDKLGPNATLVTGMLGAVEGIPVVVSEQMLRADTDGKVTDAGNGTNTGRLLCVNTSQWGQGFRRQVNVDVERDTQKRQTIITVSFRHALTERSGTRSTATHTALQYDITGI